ncbi:hypothetical protein NPIL_400471, partial [Nephila pilipes]
MLILRTFYCSGIERTGSRTPVEREATGHIVNKR